MEYNKISIGKPFLSIGSKNIHIDKVKNNTFYHSGWYFLRILLFLSQSQIHDLNVNYNIVFKAKNMIQSGWFWFYFNQTQINFIIGSKYFELYKPYFNFKININENGLCNKGLGAKY